MPTRKKDARLNAAHKKRLQALLKQPENKRCADCNARGPLWASVNLGVFVCLNCSGVHRSLGVHISVVRSVNLDTWLPEQVELMEKIGNAKAAQIFENGLSSRDKPSESDGQAAIGRFIRKKYEHKQWYSHVAWEEALNPVVAAPAEPVQQVQQPVQQVVQQAPPPVSQPVSQPPPTSQQQSPFPPTATADPFPASEAFPNSNTFTNGGTFAADFGAPPQQQQQQQQQNGGGSLIATAPTTSQTPNPRPKVDLMGELMGNDSPKSAPPAFGEQDLFGDSPSFGFNEPPKKKEVAIDNIIGLYQAPQQQQMYGGGFQQQQQGGYQQYPQQQQQQQQQFPPQNAQMSWGANTNGGGFPQQQQQQQAPFGFDSPQSAQSAPPFASGGGGSPFPPTSGGGDLLGTDTSARAVNPNDILNLYSRPQAPSGGMSGGSPYMQQQQQVQQQQQMYGGGGGGGYGGGFGGQQSGMQNQQWGGGAGGGSAMGLNSGYSAGGPNYNISTQAYMAAPPAHEVTKKKQTQVQKKDTAAFNGLSW